MAVGGAVKTPPNGPPPANPQSSPNLVSFDPKAVVPSQALYLQRNDTIGFFITTNQTGCWVRINYRWLTPDGEIKEGQLDTGVFSGFIFKTITLFEGWLLSFAAQQFVIGPAGSWAFLQAQIYRGAAEITLGDPDGIIWQGYVPGYISNGWPGTPSKEIGDGPGVLRSITGTVPGAGADISEVVPSQRRWTLLGLKATLTTSAFVTNRIVRVLLDDGANAFYLVGSSVAQVASTVINYTFTPGIPFYNDLNGSMALPIPSPTQLKSPFRIKTNTLTLNATDQWTAPQYLVAEWGTWDL